MLVLSPLLAAVAAANIAAATPAHPPQARMIMDTAAGAATVLSGSDSTNGSAGTRMSITVDSANSQIIVSTGPFLLPAKPAGMAGMDMHGMEGMEGMEHHTLSHFMRFDWPVHGWLRGFRVDMTDASGKPLPGKLLHHLIGVNLDRRQLVYHAVERLFGWGSETDPVELPSGLAVPLKDGEHLGMYAMFDNETGKEVEAYLRLTIPYVSTSDGSRPKAVLPLYVDVNNVVGGTTTFDVPPGKSKHSFEFEIPTSVRVLAVGGHLHDYGESVSLEDGETGKLLVKLKAKRDRKGHVEGVGRFVFGYNTDALHLVAGHRYRVVAEYDNPTDSTLMDGGMAHINGAVVPDDVSKWPALDRNDPLVKKDIASLPTGGIQSSAGGEVTSEVSAPHTHKIDP
ncbi:MAG TPA: hypothetical protein VIR34_17445 [Gemmatimonadaceae bacterium]